MSTAVNVEMITFRYHYYTAGPNQPTLSGTLPIPQQAENEEKKQLRLAIATMTASVLRHAMNLMGIALPEKM